MSPKETILVTGGAGYLGSHLSTLLLQNHYRVRVLDSLLFGDDGIRHLLKNPDFELIEGDIRHIDDLARSIPGCSTIVHLAAIVGDPACAVNEDVTRTVNSEATKILVELANYHHVKRLLFASSCSVYGASDNLILNEGSLVKPLSLYAETRIESEKIVLHRSNPEMTVGCLRLGTLFGLSRRMRYDLVLNIMTARAVREGQIKIWGGDQWRPLLHVADAAKAFVVGVQAPRELMDRQTYNVGCSDQNVTIAQLADLVQQYVPDVTIEVFDGNAEDRRNYRVSFDKIQTVLGFKTKISLEEGIKEIADHVTQERIDFRDDKHHNNKYQYRLAAYR